jgi:hypothetical protein
MHWLSLGVKTTLRVSVAAAIDPIEQFARKYGIADLSTINAILESAGITLTGEQDAHFDRNPLFTEWLQRIHTDDEACVRFLVKVS